MRRLLYLGLVLLCATPAFAQLSQFVDVPQPCTATPLYLFPFDFGGNADPSITNYGGCQVEVYIGPGPNTLYVDAQVDALFTIVTGGGSYSYPGTEEGYLAAPTGCNVVDHLTAWARWFQAYGDIAQTPDAWIESYISCSGDSCLFSSDEKWFGSHYTHDPPEDHGYPIC